jgi:hypothetical protein
MMRFEFHPVARPLWFAAEPPKGSTAPSQREEAPDAKASGLRVLIVEDEFYIALDVEASLGALGHTAVGIAVSADEAVRIAEAERPDVVLMDIRLAGVRDGIDAQYGRANATPGSGRKPDWFSGKAAEPATVAGRPARLERRGVKRE